MQADANDTYKILGSLDDTSASYHVIADVPNVVDRGHGLRNRALEIAPTTVRYLRFGDGDGDGFFSLSELAAYCQKPVPFPPGLRTVEATPAVVSDSAPSGTPPPPSDGGRSVLLIAAALLGIAWFGSRLFSRAAARSTHAPAAGEAATGSTVRPGAGLSRIPLHDLLRALFVASGCAALIYEVVWFHLLRLVIGASALVGWDRAGELHGGDVPGQPAVHTICPAHKDPVRVYGFLEIGIGVFGLVMPLLLPAVRFIYIGLVGYGPLGIALRAIIAAFLLLPPTALMGATLPAIARRYARGRHGMSALGGLYAANTFGAVVGCLLSAFVLLAVFDVWVATFTAVALNFAIGALALVAQPEGSASGRSRAAATRRRRRGVPDRRPHLHRGLPVRTHGAGGAGRLDPAAHARCSARPFTRSPSSWRSSSGGSASAAPSLHTC